MGRRAIDVGSLVYRLSERFPAHEQFGLRAQSRRAAVSISSNIAEGSCRFSTKEFARFVSIARGSAAEVLSQALFAAERGYIDDTAIAALEIELDELSRMLYQLKAKLDAKLQIAKAPN